MKLDIGPFVAQGVVLVEISQLREKLQEVIFLWKFFCVQALKVQYSGLISHICGSCITCKHLSDCALSLSLSLVFISILIYLCLSLSKHFAPVLRAVLSLWKTEVSISLRKPGALKQITSLGARRG